MRLIRSVSFLLLLPFISPLGAEVLVDFTVSRGGEPLGTFRARLFHEQAPRICANFVGLASGARPWLDPRTARLREGVPFYDGIRFHRLIHDFVIQGGDPLGTGGGGPGYVVQDQLHPDLRHDGRYMLSMAHAGPHSTGSQFFITLEEAPFLDDLHSVFGEVIDGREIIDAFADPSQHPTAAGDQPEEDIVMESVVVSGSGVEAFMAAHAEAGLPRWERVKGSISYAVPEDAQGGDGAGEPAMLLHWERQALRDYPVLGSRDLGAWGVLGYGLSMDHDPDYQTDVTAVYPPADGVPLSAFFQVLGLDYSHLPVPPQSVIGIGAELVFTHADGVLRLAFAAEAGTWRFEPAGAGAATSGELESFSEDVQGILPESGMYVSTERTYARLLVLRTITVFFDGPVGPQQWTAIQPTLSFHTAAGGWFDGPVNANNPTGSFRGQFEIALP